MAFSPFFLPLLPSPFLPMHASSPLPFSVSTPFPEDREKIFRPPSRADFKTFFLTRNPFYTFFKKRKSSPSFSALLRTAGTKRNQLFPSPRSFKGVPGQTSTTTSSLSLSPFPSLGRTLSLSLLARGGERRPLFFFFFLLLPNTEKERRDWRGETTTLTNPCLLAALRKRRDSTIS